MNKYFSSKWIIGILLIISSFSLKAQKASLLFAGNSLTYSNNLPEMISKLGRALDLKIKSKMICYPNYGLEDHVNDRFVQQWLSQYSFDYLILQQGPSSQAYGRQSLLTYGKQLSETANQYGVKTAFFMVWPSVRYLHTFDGVIANYSNAAQLNDAILLPVGIVWKEYLTHKKSYDLYSNDQFHPSVKGSLVAALVMLKRLFPSVNLQEIPFKIVKSYLNTTEEWDDLKLFVITQLENNP